ncbi:hypothetical protein DFH09DRAFT_1084864 [Mycena vulgaris]|nr:hypothetical protein DFH09DRAFT_1084864 [Mycena vulgaris]
MPNLHINNATRIMRPASGTYFTASGDGISHLNLNYESRFIAVDQKLRPVGLMQAPNHTSEEQMRGWQILIEEMYDLYNPSPMGQNDPQDWRTFFMKNKTEKAAALVTALQRWLPRVSAGEVNLLGKSEQPPELEEETPVEREEEEEDAVYTLFICNLECPRMVWPERGAREDDLPSKSRVWRADQTKPNGHLFSKLATFRPQHVILKQAIRVSYLAPPKFGISLVNWLTGARAPIVLHNGCAARGGIEGLKTREYPAAVSSRRTPNTSRTHGVHVAVRRAEVLYAPPWRQECCTRHRVVGMLSPRQNATRRSNSEVACSQLGHTERDWGPQGRQSMVVFDCMLGTSVASGEGTSRGEEAAGGGGG